MALTAARETEQRYLPQERVFPVAAGVKIYQGALVVMNGGLARPGRVSAADVAVGMALETADNTGGGDSAITVRVRRGTFRWLNGGGGDAIGLTEIGTNVYILADDQVGKTNPGGNTRSVAGKVYDVDALGVWIEI